MQTNYNTIDMALIKRDVLTRIYKLIPGSDNMYLIYSLKVKLLPDVRRMYLKRELKRAYSEEITAGDKLLTPYIIPNNYNLVYGGRIGCTVINHDDFLKYLFDRFNILKPGDYIGNSMSAFDIVAIRDNSEWFFYMVDQFGWCNLDEFIGTMPIFIPMEVNDNECNR